MLDVVVFASHFALRFFLHHTHFTFSHTHTHTPPLPPPHPFLFLALFSSFSSSSLLSSFPFSGSIHRLHSLSTERTLQAAQRSSESPPTVLVDNAMEDPFAPQPRPIILPATGCYNGHPFLPPVVASCSLSIYSLPRCPQCTSGCRSAHLAPCHDRQLAQRSWIPRHRPPCP